MNLRQLSFFVAVAEELHFGRAAARLCMTQPPLSQAILALERELGVELFRRTKRHVELSPCGQHLLPHARQLLADADALPDLARHLAYGTCGSLRLGFDTLTEGALMPELAGCYSAKYPAVDLILHDMGDAPPTEALLQGDIDAALVMPPASLPPTLAYLGLAKDPLLAAVPEQWILTGKVRTSGARLLPAALADLPMICMPRQRAPSFHDLVANCLLQLDVKAQTGQEALRLQTCISLVSVGMGVALVPSRMQTENPGGVRFLEVAGLSHEPVIEIGLTWRGDSPSPTVTQLVKVARSMLSPDVAPAVQAAGMA
ncbi:LysR family transcriptional regulator [Pseudohoeflea coraliihabitans]|uniref:LysR family transcriptional regulator n=1 Tax=Pseudohoeflea coraliihabitans TaxID=2860393 RepID=A0ABS6WPN8_9HYPH|nr:LysR family transcriptional regulator [Pseudohoeflea sp. DP4N28-3]MBW3097916.1 LysR family transcriptional regulator [Pseudohoeflea sp. DP4N28-3]